ncbi:hypothetical protein OJ996_11190 [Luteolibacter sp. GHJ8]|uniref:Uncharacterized protein n=1 Tax=Luteolibacter rhizosphaerae TaxID=2989719 RepID=A0ABT3G3S7_9BACT|nr:hypothetical protein [Luteolibacter rhizosphaerae]MCW1914144.1 hypothetical protein [Luteolibacter rhizosphaerae]
MLANRFATTRECRWPGARCWISSEISFRPYPDAPSLTPGTIVALAERGDLWVQIPYRCVLMDQRGLCFSKEYLTRRQRWIPESDPRVRTYLLFKLNEARALEDVTCIGYSYRLGLIRSYKHALRRNAWYADQQPGDGDEG